MTRTVPPPDFRYVSLQPSGAPGAMAITAVGLGTAGMALLATGHEPLALAVTFAGGAVASLFFRHGSSNARPGSGVRHVPMAIVPWGVVVEPDAAPHILRWPAIREIAVHLTHTLRGGTPTIESTVVTVKTERELYAGRTSGAAGLESLTANLEAYAEEAGRPVARDLEGRSTFSGGATEPVVEDLFRVADDLCASARGAACLCLPTGGYRSVASRTAAPETVAILRGALSATHTDADPRPLAAILAAMLGAHDLAPDLVRLVNAPHPVAAAVARAAALRLGSPRNRVGAIDEIAAFLFEEDLQRIERWAEGRAGAVATPPPA